MIIAKKTKNVIFFTRGDIGDVESFALGNNARGGVNAVRVPKTDLLVMPFGITDSIDLASESMGKTNTLSRLRNISSLLDCCVFAGCETTALGCRHISCAVFDRGSLLGVSDMCHVIDDETVCAGGGFRVYDTSCGKIGAVVGEDLYFPETARVLTLCDADFLVCTMGKIRSHIPELLLRASAYQNGVPIACVAQGYALAASVTGEILMALDASIIRFGLDAERDYHLVSARRRGQYRVMGS